MPRLLIVDDEDRLRGNIAAFMEDEGFEVTDVASGEDAVALVDGGAKFDVCIMDMRLPGIDGEETMLALQERTPDLLYVVHTGTAGYSLPPELRSLGLTSDYVFMKPMNDLQPMADALHALAREGAYRG